MVHFKPGRQPAHQPAAVVKPGSHTSTRRTLRRHHHGEPTMSSPDVRLHPSDAAELGELLQFLDDWLTRNREHRAPSLAEFVGHPGYDIPQLQADLNRFVFLLGTDDGERLFGTE
jgi:hypothetical protein